MATHSELMQLANNALSKIGKTDITEAESFVAMWEALVPTIPQPEFPPPPPPPPNGESEPEAIMVVSFTPQTEEHKQRVAAIQEQTRQLIREIDEAAPA